MALRIDYPTNAGCNVARAALEMAAEYGIESVGQDPFAENIDEGAGAGFYLLTEMTDNDGDVHLSVRLQFNGDPERFAEAWQAREQVERARDWERMSGSNRPIRARIFSTVITGVPSRPTAENVTAAVIKGVRS